jgi:hypothetical protein
MAPSQVQISLTATYALYRATTIQTQALTLCRHRAWLRAVPRYMDRKPPVTEQYELHPFGRSHKAAKLKRPISISRLNLNPRDLVEDFSALLGEGHRWI